MSTVIFNYFKYMERQNIEFHFLVNDYIDKNLKSEIIRMGGSIHLMHNRNKKPWIYISQLRHLAKKEKFDIVHVHGNSATMEFEMLAFKGLSTKKIVHVHGVNTQHPLVHRILYPMFKNSYDVAFAASSQAGEWLIKNRPFTIINNGIDVKRFLFDEKARKRIRELLNIDDERPVVLHVGAFSEQKNHDFLIRTFEKFHQTTPTALLILIGKGKNISVIKEYCRTHGLLDSVRFLGERNNTEDFYSAADLFLFPSKFEPFGIVTLEAQCSGLPVIASDVLPKEVNITSNVSFLALSEGYESWANVISKRLSESHSNRLQKTFYQIFEDKGYSIVKNAQQMKKYYFELAKD
ncbi:glycosyltransferase [Lactiplantibacillus mudanjiangensis]|uniref:glycosyltransferase n=1 Tax=Lactiplantibacillus mudanjiangensis TaxID=1296538 RepID=UPI0013EF1311